MNYSELVKATRKIYTQEVADIINDNDDVPPKLSLYMSEVIILKAFMQVITGFNEDVNKDPDVFHDYACSIVDEIHNKFDV